MIWNTHYIPPDKNKWQGRPDTPPASSFFQIVQMLNLLDAVTLPEVTQPAFVLMGFKCDEGVRRNGGRVGAAEGPLAIRQALAKLALQKSEIVCFDAGNIVCTDGDLEAAQQSLAEVVTLLLQHHFTPIVLGGGHEVSLGHYLGIDAAHQNRQLGIVNFDSHFDMRPLVHEKGNSGTPFLQIAEHRQTRKHNFDYNCIGIQHASNIRQLFETAKLFNTKIILADELHQGQLEKCIDFVDRMIDENEMIYLSLCLDVFAAAFAPGVSATQPLGLYPWHLIPLIRQLAMSGKVISYDIAELAPRYDIDHCTAKLAANLIYEIIHHHCEHGSPVQ